MDSSLNFLHKKRSFSPTIDDIRQHNIKRFRLLSDFNSLNLSSDRHQSLASSSSEFDRMVPEGDKNKEYIPDIDEFLIQNQDDYDILESSKQIKDIQTVDPDQIVIPSNVVTKVMKLSKFDSQMSYERIKARRHFEEKYKENEANCIKKKDFSYISNMEILEDFRMLKFFGLIKYYNPILLIYKVWEFWYSNVFKLRESDELFDKKSSSFNQPNGIIDDDLMIDEYYDENENNSMRLLQVRTKLENSYGGNYHNVSNDESMVDNDSPYLDSNNGEDMMDLD